MAVLSHIAAPGWLTRVDPRARVIAALALATLVVVVHHFGVLLIALVAAVLAWAFSGLPWREMLRRLLPLNLLMLALAGLLPLTTAGAPVAQWGPLQFSHEGFLLAAAIALKGNIVMLLVLTLLSTMDATTLGHALSHLHVPDKLTHLLLFTVRYLDVLQRESQRLRAALKIRGFRPGMNRHTYRTFGYLVGVLLVRSFDRAERILAAMKCRGFRGRFFLLDHFAFSRRDVPFCVAVAALFSLLIVLEWGPWL